MTSPRIDVHLTPDDLSRDLADDVRRGLTSRPKALPPKYFYDARGSELFEEITRLPEYYPTRAERAILATHAEQIAKLANTDTLVELGSGSSSKTRLLIEAMRNTGGIRRYVPVDVSASALTAAADELHTDYEDVEIHGIVGDLEHQLDLLPREGRRLLAFLGGTIGNQTPAERAKFLTALRGTMGPDDALLLGAGLVIDAERLVRAYDDDAGVTAEFNRNVLHVINHSLDADFTPEAFAHVAVWDADHEWIEMRLRSRRSQVVQVRGLGLEVPFAAGEEMRTEISAKFRRDGLETELANAGFSTVGWWADDADDFALALAVVTSPATTRPTPR